MSVLRFYPNSTHVYPNPGLHDFLPKVGLKPPKLTFLPSTSFFTNLPYLFFIPYKINLFLAELTSLHFPGQYYLVVFQCKSISA